MSVSRSEAFWAARKRLRTFGSAPDPKKQAREVYSELVRADGWTPRERDAIETFGAWLLDYPATSELRPRCEQLLATLAEN
jgi:hypothetical protein